MKQLIILLIAFSICSCNSKTSQQEKTETKQTIIHSIKVKASNIQACLDSIGNEERGNNLEGYTLVLLKRDEYETGFDSLHIGNNRIFLEEMPKGKDLRNLDPNKSRDHKVYIDIEYRPKSENNLDISFQFFYFNTDWNFHLIKEGSKWKIKSVKSGIS